MDVAAVGGTSSSPEIHQRRQSLSSVEDPRDLEEGHASVRPSTGPRGAVAKLANKLKDSFVSTSSNTDHTIWTARTDYAYDTRLLYKRRITNLYISFTNLRSYVEINYSGFRKIIKKCVATSFFVIPPPYFFFFFLLILFFYLQVRQSNLFRIEGQISA